MKNGISTFEERLAGRPLIDWAYVYMHPECVSMIWERYLLDNCFRVEVNRRLLSKNPLNQVFKVKFYQYFGDLLEEHRKTMKRH